MKNRLLAQLPQHKTCLCSIYNPHLYIVDWKDYNKGAVEISGAQRNVINAVHILNENNVKVFFDAFPENALPIIIRKSKFPPNPERSVLFSGKRTKRSVQKKGCTQHL